MCDLAEAYGWAPNILKHMSIAELVYWSSRGESKLSKEEILKRLLKHEQRSAYRAPSGSGSNSDGER